MITKPLPDDDATPEELLQRRDRRVGNTVLGKLGEGLLDGHFRVQRLAAGGLNVYDDIVPAQSPTTQFDGLSNAELTKLLGFKSSGAVSNAAGKGEPYFREWSAGHDPHGRAWTFTGENKNRRFFPAQDQALGVPR